MRSIVARRVAGVCARHWVLGCALVLSGCSGSPSPTTDATIDARDDGDVGIDAADGRVPLDPLFVPHFAQPLVVPPAMVPESRDGGVTEYHVTARQVRQQVLPAPFPATTVWAYGRDSDPGSFHSPGATIEARSGERVRVVWRNDLVDDAGQHLPHLLPVDDTLHWADPRPAGARGPSGLAYLGPVPLVPHVHGAHARDDSDGNPEAWFLPDAVDLTGGYTLRGSDYHTRRDDGAGTAVFEYDNDQPAATLWYHDHALGLTRLNVYAGLAGFWLVHDAVDDALGLPGPAPSAGDPAGTRYYDLPLAIQDRAFWSDGSLRYPARRDEFDHYAGPYRPDGGAPPVWNPEVLGNVMLVNGVAWPYLEVEPRLYRLRILNGSNARFLVLRFENPDVRFIQIGADGGLLSLAPVSLDTLTLAPGERADVLVDFSALPVASATMLRNVGPDAPYAGPAAGQSPADPLTTGRVMQFRRVEPTAAGRPGAIPATLPAVDELVPDAPARALILAEDGIPGTDTVMASMLGTAHEGPLHWDDPATETPRAGSTEAWRIANLTPDAHPIHLHLVRFRVLDRTPFDADGFAAAQALWRAGQRAEPTLDEFVRGPPYPAEANESGWKDTVRALPRTITRIVARFDLPGRYVWHCHMLEHEDNEMMRPLVVLP